MKKLGKLKLNDLRSVDLNREEMNKFIGGSCSCQCSGPLSNSNNTQSNYSQGLCICSCGGSGSYSANMGANSSGGYGGNGVF